MYRNTMLLHISNHHRHRALPSTNSTLLPSLLVPLCSEITARGGPDVWTALIRCRLLRWGWVLLVFGAGQELQLLMKKQKDGKGSKRDAFMSFLESSATPTTSSEISTQNTPAKSAIQDDCYEEYVEDMSGCSVCGKDIDPAKKKKCGFCNMVACNDHLRKRRRKKGKFQKICDGCEDKVLYDIYMKLEAKAEEAIGVEEEITYLKHENFLKEVEERREKRRDIAFKTMTLQQKYNQESSQLAEQERRVQELEQTVLTLELSVQQSEVFVQRVEANMRQNCEQDYNIISQENQRMAKQLTKLEKKCLEIRNGIQKREREIEEAFQSWEQRQFKKKLENEEKAAAARKKNEGCVIF